MRTSVILFLSVLSLVCGSVADAEPIRVCADPDNLPYTSQDTQTPGFYLELAKLLATRLDRQLDYYWWRNFQGGRSVRLTLLAGKCDWYFGLPYQKGTRYLLTKPFLQAGYAMVVPPALTVTRLDDLQGKKVGVQFSSPPQDLLATRNDIEAVTFRYPEEAMEALRSGRIDAAFIWGPTAGYINQHDLNRQYRVVPIAGPDLQWRIAIGLRKRDAELKTQIDRELRQLEAAITQLAERYGFPQRAPQPLAQRDPVSSPPPTSSAALTATALRNPFDRNPEVVQEGNSLFNQFCSRCHGTDGRNAKHRQDLTKFHKRHPGTSDPVFYTIVTQGRPSKGMPAIGRALSEVQLWKIKTFLNTVQQK